MKKALYVAASVAALGVTPAVAGSLGDPIVTPVVIIDDTTTSSSSATAMVLLLAMLMAIPVLD